MGHIEIKLSRLDKFSFQEAVEVWNEGFAGYFTDMNRTLHKHIEYLGANSVYPEYSVVAVIDGKPAGFVLTAIRTCEGIKTAWNAGTGVAPAYRGMGVGKAMMGEAVRIYREQGIHTAYLEAIFENKRAIALYGSCGFQVQERIFWYSRKGSAVRPLFSEESQLRYRVIRASLREAGMLSFYRGNVPWCNQWPNIHGGEAMLVLDESDVIAGYALFRRTFNVDGKLAEIKLLQGEADPQREDGLDAARFLLAEVYSPYPDDFMRTAENIPESNVIFSRLLKEAGLEVVLDQNMMVLDLNLPIVQKS
jgi:ribosomal protein S18 acetylase RimI-like enzyme